MGRGLGVENVLSTLVHHDRYEISSKTRSLLKTVNLLVLIGLKLCTGKSGNNSSESCILNKHISSTASNITIILPMQCYEVIRADHFVSDDYMLCLP